MRVVVAGALFSCALMFAAAAELAAQDRPFCVAAADLRSQLSRTGSVLAASMVDADGDRREIHVRPDGHWLEIWLPHQAGGEMACLAAVGTAFVPHVSRLGRQSWAEQRGPACPAS